MAKKNSNEVGRVSPSAPSDEVGRVSPSAPSDEVGRVSPSAPAPINRMVTRDMVRVRANVNIGEEINGDMCRFAKGDEFELPAERAAVLGPLIDIL